MLVTEDDRGHERQIGRYILQHTTPLNSPEIEALTIHWRWRCFFITVAIFAVYGAILKGILLPMRRVISCLEREDLPAPVIMLRPGSLLERAYNNLARDACVTKLAAGLRDRIARDPSMDPVQLLEQIPQDLLVYFRFRDVNILSFRADEGGSLWIAEGVHGLGGTQKPGQNHAGLAEALRRQVAARPPKDSLDEWKNFLGDYRTDRGENAWYFASWVDHRSGPETIFLLVLTARNTEFSSLTAWHRETCRLAADQVRLALEHLSSQKRVILQEKSKANISLSRNLGHDLTQYHRNRKTGFAERPQIPQFED